MNIKRILFGVLISTLAVQTWAESPKMKMTTEVLEIIMIPGKLETSITRTAEHSNQLSQIN